MKYTGQFITATGTIPASSDAGKLFRLMGSPGAMVQIQYVQDYGGDTDETVQLHLCPPNTPQGVAPSAVPGCIAITPLAYITGAGFTQDAPQALGSANDGRGAPRFNAFIVPPDYQVMMVQASANTAAWTVTIGGHVLGE